MSITIWFLNFTKRMRSLLSFILLGLMILTGCIYSSVSNETISDRTFSLNDTIKIKNFTTLISEDNKLSLKMDSVPEDSRCPTGMECFWSGNAVVRFYFGNNKRLRVFALNTTTRKDTIILGYNIKLLSLTPYPESYKRINQKDYYALVTIRNQ